MLKRVLGTALGLSMSATSHGVVILSDTEFLDANWNTIEVRDDGGNSTGTGAQQAAGGNPGAYRQGQNIMGGPTTVRYAHMYTAATYDPSTQGAISSIDWTYDFIAESVTNPTTGAIASAIVIEQGGQFYLAAPTLTLPTPPPVWTTISDLGETAADFFGVDAAALNPDFSATGGVISFGWLTSNSTGQANGRTGTWGLDNWQFTINQVTASVPEPSILWLLGAGLFGIPLWRRRAG